MPRYPITLLPQGVIPRDLDLTLRLPRTPEPVIKTVIVEVPATGGDACVPAVLDTFTAADATKLLAHTGETGATWTRTPGWGIDDDDEYVIYSNKLRRPVFGETPAGDGATALAYPSGTLPASPYSIRLHNLSFAANTTSASIALYEKADTLAGAAEIFEMGNPRYEGANGIVVVGPGATFTGIPFAFVSAQLYEVRLEVNGTAMELFVDDVSTATWTRTAPLVGPIGLEMGDYSSEGLPSIEGFELC